MDLQNIEVVHTTPFATDLDPIAVVAALPKEVVYTFLIAATHPDEVIVAALGPSMYAGAVNACVVRWEDVPQILLCIETAFPIDFATFERGVKAWNALTDIQQSRFQSVIVLVHASLMPASTAPAIA